MSPAEIRQEVFAAVVCFAIMFLCVTGFMYEVAEKACCPAAFLGGSTHAVSSFSPHNQLSKAPVPGKISGAALEPVLFAEVR